MFGALAQLASALPWHGRGHRFESDMLHHFFMKQVFKNIIVRLLWAQVSRLRKKHSPITIAVAGSIGKTGTKTAIATVLSEHLRVQWQNGNYNDIVSVPLVFFGQKMPALYNPIGWLRVFIASEFYIQTRYPYQAVVVELGTDRRGDLDLFKQCLEADYGVLTAIAPEHMENFKDIDAVADEELTIGDIAKTIFVSTEATDAMYIKRLRDPFTYGCSANDDCSARVGALTSSLQRSLALTFADDGSTQNFKVPLIGKQGLPAVSAAVSLARKLELTEEEILRGVGKLQPLSGRMNPLTGRKGSLLIDDTYNSSPEAAIAALQTLYEIKSSHKVAILGQMNELGHHSKKLHQQVGDFCDPTQLDLVLTIGEDANKHLAKAAQKQGCEVVKCPTPYHAADILLPLIHKDTVVFAKGSQNGVYAEEAIKLLLDNPKDVKKLVRQSRSWLKKKDECFSED